jgi:hypothetical protein
MRGCSVNGGVSWFHTRSALVVGAAALAVCVFAGCSGDAGEQRGDSTVTIEAGRCLC